jgi:hypothetical protein
VATKLSLTSARIIVGQVLNSRDSNRPSAGGLNVVPELIREELWSRKFLGLSAWTTVAPAMLDLAARLADTDINHGEAPFCVPNDLRLAASPAVTEGGAVGLLNAPKGQAISVCVVVSGGLSIKEERRRSICALAEDRVMTEWIPQAPELAESRS